MIRTLILAFAFIVVCFSSLQVTAQQVFKTTSPSTIAYYEYVPQDYHSNSNKYPVMIFLHGIGERGPNSTDPNILKQYISAVAKLGPPMYVKNGTQFPFILISPQLKNNYGTWPASYVMEVINHVKNTLRIDEKRIFLTGLSLGGGGVWMTAQDYPALFAAIAPVCGGYNTLSKACNIASENLPVWAFHGDIDTTVPLSRTVNMVNAINNCTPKPSPLAKLTIYPNVAHSAWTNAYKIDNSIHNPNLYQWVMSYTNTVNKGNKIPTANAGADVAVAATSVTITGSGADIDGTINSFSWSQLTGPSKATLTNSTTSSLKVSNLLVGQYEFKLQVTDNSGNTDSDYVIVTVDGAAPIANAGPDKNLALPTNAVTIVGSGTDSDGYITSYAWTKVSGSNAVISGANAATVNISSLVQGSYVFRLTVTDDKGVKRSDDVTVSVTGTTNPVANAGADKTITLPTTYTTLTGTGSDANGSIVGFRWVKIAGPICSYSGNTTPTVSVTKLVAGTYTFRFTVTDNSGATGYDDVRIVVKDPLTSTASVYPTGEIVDDPSGSMMSEDNVAVLGDLTMSQLKNSTVTIFNDGGERIFSGDWNRDSFQEVMRDKGMYLYHVVREGKMVNSGKIALR
jgi:dienelactone hydrolase